MLESCELGDESGAPEVASMHQTLLSVDGSRCEETYDLRQVQPFIEVTDVLDSRDQEDDSGVPEVASRHQILSPVHEGVCLTKVQ